MRNHVCAMLLAILLGAAPLAAAKKAIVPPEFAPAPGAAAPNYSPGVLVDGTLYITGQIGQNLKTKEIPADFDTELKVCLDNIGIVLKAAGMTFKDAVAVQVYLTDIDLFAHMNTVYRTYFAEPRPTRTTVQVVKLAEPKAHVEITVTARK